MQKGDIFEFTADNGVSVRAICLDRVDRQDYYDGSGYESYLCYAQNRLFYYIQNFTVEYNEDSLEPECTSTWELGNTLVDYCVIPEWDEVLKSLE